MRSACCGKPRWRRHGNKFAADRKQGGGRISAENLYREESEDRWREVAGDLALQDTKTAFKWGYQSGVRDEGLRIFDGMKKKLGVR